MSNALSLFSATYVLLQLVMTILAQRVSGKHFVALEIITCGALCMAHAAIRSTATLFAFRLLIGAAEAGFTMAAFNLMSTMYPKYSAAFRFALFSGTYAVADAFAGLIAYGLLHVDSPQIHGWQAVFLFEGGITVLLGLASLFVLSRSEP